jgi:peptidoglycan/LPS O-acetylase OafA/YrhL
VSYPPPSHDPDEHHYPPSTADWVTSPLAAEDELPHNPLEQTDTSAPGRRLGALLVIVGGLLAIAGSVLQWTQMIHLAPWYLWLVLFTSGLALGAAGGSLGPLLRAASKGSGRVRSFTFAAIAVQVIEMVVTLVASSAHAVPAGGVWVSVGSVLLLLAGAMVHRRAGWRQTSVQDRVDQAEVDQRMAALPPQRWWSRAGGAPGEADLDNWPV